MMPSGNLARMVVANTLRSRRHFVLSAFGIVIGIATFVVFLASTEQVGTVLEKIFPVEQVQVIAPRASLLGKDISKKLDDAIVQKIRSRPEVDRADPTAVVVWHTYTMRFTGIDLHDHPLASFGKVQGEVIHTPLFLFYVVGLVAASFAYSLRVNGIGTWRR